MCFNNSLLKIARFVGPLTIRPFAKNVTLKRERENLLHPFEVACDHTPKRYLYIEGEKPEKSVECAKADYERCVKEYKRPTVGKQEVNPHDLRPPGVLIMTVNYLIDSIATRGVSWSEIYDFMFDRLRSVRQDLVIQNIQGKEAIVILEKVVRFHIYSDYRLCTEHISIFDQKINNQHTQECLKRLINLYKRQGTSQQEVNNSGTSHTGSWKNSNFSCRNQAEFEATYLLFNLGDVDALNHFYTLDKILRKDPTVRLAYNMSIAYLLNNWVRVFRLVKKLTFPVHLCVIGRHFQQLQRQAVYSMNIGYSSKNLKFPIDKLTELLFLNTDTETQNLCQRHGLSVIGSYVHFFKSSYQSSEKTERSSSDYIKEKLRCYSIPDILHGHKDRQNVVGSQLQDSDDLWRDLQSKCSVK